MSALMGKRMERVGVCGVIGKLDINRCGQVCLILRPCAGCAP